MQNYRCDERDDHRFAGNPDHDVTFSLGQVLGLAALTVVVALLAAVIGQAM